MCLTYHDTRSISGFFSRSTILLVCVFYIHLTKADVPAGQSSLTLYQGVTKFELDARDCPVGVAFHQPERFSCACLNGIWAFYSDPCAPPIAIVGGSRHCFPMPPDPISAAIIVGNPLRGLGDSLSVFEAEMNTVRAKFYRNVKMYMPDANDFVSLNSSWTLISPDGSRSICLEKRDVVFEGLTTEEASAFPDLTYCSFVNVSAEMPVIGTVRKGCNSSMVLEAIQCQPILPSTEENEVCLDDQLISAYQDVITEANKELDPVAAELQNIKLTRPKLSGALESLGRFYRPKRVPQLDPVAAVMANNSTPAPVDEDTPPKYPRTYLGEPEWHQRLLFMNLEGAQPPEPSPEQAISTPAPEAPEAAIPIDLEKAWNNSQLFLAPVHASNGSNILITNHLWMYYRYAIRNALNITRLVPPDEQMSVKIETGKVKKLFSFHTGVMKKICPLTPPSFFETVTGTFISLLIKSYRWKEPYVEQTIYMRILASLTSCKNRAEKLSFVPERNCSAKATNFIVMPDATGEGSVNVKVSIPPKFQSEHFEPIIEAVWKIFLSVHSYCFKDFSDQYQDHHKYTTLMMGLFSNKINDIWMRNRTADVEYSGVLGDIALTMKAVEQCAVGARMTSEYPFHMSRPTKMFRYRDDSGSSSERAVKPAHAPAKKNKRTKRNVDAPEMEKADLPLSRVKRLAINAVNSDNVLGHTVFGGQGLCLKKYSDPKSTVGKYCKRDTRKKQEQFEK